MTVENSRTISYQEVVRQAETHAYLSCAGELPTSDATTNLVIAAINAYVAGLSQEEITAALSEGETRGATLYADTRAINDPEYWKAIRAEAEAFWAKRYDPYAAEDW